jgi:hypothetical protein
MKKIHLTLGVSLSFLLLNSCSTDLQEDYVISQKKVNLENANKVVGTPSGIDATEADNNNLAIASRITLGNGVFFATGPAPYGKAYFVFEGRPRHIESELTLRGLFINVNIPTDINSYSYYSYYISTLPTDPLLILYGVAGQTLGLPLKANNGLVHHVQTGKIYFREGNVIRYIPSMEIFNKYHFNMAALTNVGSISSYSIGSNVY